MSASSIQILLVPSFDCLLSCFQLFSGVVVLVMVAFPSENCPSSNTLTTGKIFCAHVANVLIAAALGVLDPLTIDTFPEKYR